MDDGPRKLTKRERANDGVLKQKRAFEGTKPAYSPFGPFPSESDLPKKAKEPLPRARPRQQRQLEAAPEVPKKEFLKSHKGLGGMCSSTQKAKPRAAPAPPKSDVFKKRPVRVCFRG